MHSAIRMVSLGLSCCMVAYYVPIEYLLLDKQLDDLDQALDVLERQSDHLNEEAKQLLLDAKAARSNAPTETGGSPGEAGREESTEKKGSSDSDPPSEQNT